jgi:beta-lactamase regulating signal transducer with metallopeptidase domain
MARHKSKMNSTLKTISLYLIIWLILSAGYFYFSEALTKKMFPAYENVELWLIVLISGLAIIFVTVFLALSINLKRKKKLILGN